MAAGLGSLARFFSPGAARRSRALSVVAPMQEKGTTGAFETGGFLHTEERNAELRGPKRYLTFSNLLANTAIVAAGTRAFLNLLGNSTWTVTPAETDNEGDATRAQEIADSVWDIFNDMERPWSRVVRRSGSYRFYGFSIQEWTAKRRDDGTLGYRDVAARPQPTIERWALDDHGKVLGVTQLNPKTQEEIPLPRGKLVHIVDDALSDSPEGLGLFRHLVESHHRLERYQMLEAFGFETDLKGIPVARIPYAKLQAQVKAGLISQGQMNEIVKPMEDFVRSHIKSVETGLAIDSSPYRATGETDTPSATLEWDISLLKGTPTSQPDMANAIERLTREMAIVLGVQGLLLGGDGSGSLALGRAFSEQFAQLVDSALGEIAECYEQDLIAPLVRMNGWPEELAPKLETEQTKHHDVDQITKSLRDLADAGAPILPDDPAVNFVRQKLGAPEQDPDAAAIDAALQREPPEPPAVPEPEPEPGPEPPDPENE